MRHAFLTQRLRPIAPVEVIRNGYLPGCNYITRANYEYLRACVQRYAELSGRPFAHDPGLTPGEGIGNLYRELRAMIGPDIGLNIETDGEKLVFVLWRYYRWGEYYYYWIPVKFVEKLNPALRRIAISFLHQFMRSNGLDTPNRSEDFYSIIENFLERAQDEHEDDPAELARLAKAYSPDGRVGKLMQRIETKNDHKDDLGIALDGYVPQSEYESELVALMQRGRSFIGENKPSILSCAYDPFRDEEDDHDYWPVFPERMIRLTYDVHAEIEVELRRWIQDELNNGYEVMAAATLTLRPDGSELFREDDYPTAFYAYLDDLLNFLTGGPLWTRMR